MVERTTASFEEFVGKVENILLEDSMYEGESFKQYHLMLKPKDKEIKGKTGQIHEWIKISPKTTDTSVPEGSILDRYLQQIEILFAEAKQKQSHIEAMQLLIGKSFKFKKIKLGQSYEGKEAKMYWTPVGLA